MAEANLMLSVVIKALNEEANIERTLRSVLSATQGLHAEVILADSLSTDRTCDIAAQFPIRIVQLAQAADRSCGVGAQLGYQHALGRYILVMDGDMELERDFVIAAIQRLDERADLAGVGGLVNDVNMDNIEFRARQTRHERELMVGPVDRLYGGGLYRRSAIEEVGYLTNRNLHGCEELELGLRLGAAGWKLERIGVLAIHHYGHTVPMWTLIRRRWRSRYVCGAGELIRASIGQPWFAAALRCFMLPLAVIGWWVVLAGLVVMGVADDPSWFWVLLCVLLFPPLVMIAKKRSLELGLYAILAWSVDTAGMVRGFLVAQQPPEARVPSRTLDRPT